MGKDLKGKELGKGITQESTGLYSAYLFLQVDHLVGHYFLFPNQSTNLAEYNPVLSWDIPLPGSLPFKFFPIFQLLS